MYRAACWCATAALAAAATAAGPPPLSDYFGFSGLEIVKIDPDAGPLAVADVSGDGLLDLIVVNNHASRIELHVQRRDAEPGDFPRPERVNQLPEHWRFERRLLSVSHRVQAVVPHDFDADGRLDLIYAGTPGELVFLRQQDDGQFTVANRHRVRDLAAGRNGLAVGDVIGDGRPELLAIAGGEIRVWPMDGDRLDHPVRLSAGDDLVAFMPADYNGDGHLDVAAVLPEDPAPVRLWLSERHDERGVLGPQVRFEMPPLIEFHPFRLPGLPAARAAAIERASKRIVLYELVVEPIRAEGDRDASMEGYSFTDPGNRTRAVAVTDLDGDGLLDFVATDTRANALVAWHQAAGEGLQPGRSFPCYADLEYLAAGDVDDDPYAELFVLSEDEGVVGRCDVGPDGIPYPAPLALPEGKRPVALNLVELEDGRHRLAVVVRDGRDYAVVLLDLTGGSKTVPLGTESRSPETILALDADQDGRTDLLLFTRDKPMKMLRAGEEGFSLLESRDMGQFGLVKAAKADNTAVFDIDGDGRRELLIADQNYVRAVRYEPEPPAGISPGWQVVEQINAADSTSRLVSLAVLDRRVIAADREHDRLVIMSRTGDGEAPWRGTESIDLRGFSFEAIHAGALSGDGNDNILAVGHDGFGVVRLGGRGWALREFASWRTDEKRRRQHELASGDVNGDGFTDLISLDAGEQMCEIFTFDADGRLHYVTGFQVFESKIFSGGEPREYQPSSAHIADVTGDGADDLILLAHDRVLIYPQMTVHASARSSRAGEQ